MGMGGLIRTQHVYTYIHNIRIYIHTHMHTGIADSRKSFDGGSTGRLQYQFPAVTCRVTCEVSSDPRSASVAFQLSPGSSLRV